MSNQKFRKKFRGGFGERLRELRLRRGWSQPDLAQRLDVSNAAVGFWEIGVSRPRADAIVKLAVLLDTTPEFLLSGEEGAPLSADAPAPADIAELLAVVDETERVTARLRRAADKFRRRVNSSRGSNQSSADPATVPVPPALEQLMAGEPASRRKDADALRAGQSAGVPHRPPPTPTPQKNG